MRDRGPGRADSPGGQQSRADAGRPDGVERAAGAHAGDHPRVRRRAARGPRGSRAGLAGVLSTRGLLARAQDRYAASAEAYAEALALARSAGNSGEEATALLGLAYAAMFTGDAARAGALTEESLAAARRSQDRLILAQALFFLGWGASNTGAYERAEALGAEALELFAELGEAGEH